MDELDHKNPQNLPRWLTMPIGIVLAPFTLFCVVGSAIILVAPNVPPSFLTISIGSIFLAGSLWVFYLSLRLLFVNPNSGSKFVSPNGLRVVGLVFIAIPIISLILGTFWERPVLNSIMAVAYLGVVIKLFSMAKNRGQNA